MTRSASGACCPPPSEASRINLVQGEQHVSGHPDLIVSTLLGSCVAACLHDPVGGVGGINHFLLPGRAADKNGDALRFGVHAMELLVNALLGAGARRDRLEAKLFGGAQMLGGLTDVGRQNSEFALAFLEAESIRYLGGSLGGVTARRVQFWPAWGRARQRVANPGEEALLDQEARRRPAAHHALRDCGSVELF